jgi:uncharacterized membrane protein YfcA
LPTVTVALALIIFVAGTIAGSLGALLGLGGGIFLVPFLNLGMNFPLQAAAAISLTTVIATSSSVSAARSGKQLINLRLGMVLEVATAAGSLLAQMLPQSTLQILFGIMSAIVGVIMLGRIRKRNVILDPSIDPGVLGGRFHEEESGGIVTYQVKRLPVALFASFIAGNVSSLLGVGGGVIKVPVLNAWCGIPMRAAAATSAFMIGVTATAGAVIYYGHGQLIPGLAAAAVLGVQLGTWGGMHFGSRASAKWLKVMMAAVLLVVSVLMFARGIR